jgi:hypothetical protein
LCSARLHAFHEVPFHDPKVEVQCTEKKKKIIVSCFWKTQKVTEIYALMGYYTVYSIVKAIPVHAWTGPEGSRRSGLPEF